MSNAAFVSIIIPVKNFERTIEKTFEYLLNVDYPGIPGSGLLPTEAQLTGQ